MALENKAAQEIVSHARPGEGGLSREHPTQLVAVIPAAAHDAYLRGRDYLTSVRGMRALSNSNMLWTLAPRTLQPTQDSLLLWKTKRCLGRHLLNRLFPKLWQR